MVTVAVPPCPIRHGSGGDRDRGRCRRGCGSHGRAARGIGSAERSACSARGATPTHSAVGRVFATVAVMGAVVFAARWWVRRLSTTEMLPAASMITTVDTAFVGFCNRCGRDALRHNRSERQAERM